MIKGRLFQNGRSQAIRLPKQCRLDCDEVYINKIGNVLMIVPANNSNAGWDVFEALPPCQDFFPNGRQDLLPDKKDVEEM